MSKIPSPRVRRVILVDPSGVTVRDFRLSGAPPWVRNRINFKGSTKIVHQFQILVMRVPYACLRNFSQNRNHFHIFINRKYISFFYLSTSFEIFCFILFWSRYVTSFRDNPKKKEKRYL